jgi:hypothetical protein
MVNFNAEHKAVLDDMLLDHPDIRPGKAFGYPAYYVGKKLSICLFEQGVGLKVPQELAEKLVADDRNVIPFQPYGRRKMREWIQINLDRSEDYRNYMSVFEASIRYLHDQADKSG